MNKKEYIKRKTRFRKHINHELCSTCIKCCCKSCGCDAIPLDIDPFTPKHIIELIDKGIYSISIAYSSIEVVLPILRTRELEAGIFNFSNKHKQCSLLGEHGCMLSEEERPTLALLLIPRPYLFDKNQRNCKQLFNTKQFLKMWWEKIDVMEEVVKHYTGGKEFETLYKEYRDEK